MGEDVWEWLDSLKGGGINKSLEPTKIILNRLDNPQESFPAVHVAGSNGKGTCCAILANSLTINNTRTGLFSSPHLISVNERIRIDGKSIDNHLFEKLLEQIQTVCKATPEINPTFYEVTFIAAMLAFRNHDVDRAVIETGLGGRWDATRLVNADCCILTQISLDHTEILGDTHAKIAAEKAAIVRENLPFLSIYDEDEDVREAIEKEIDGKTKVNWVDCSQLTMKDTAVELAKEALRILGIKNSDKLIQKSRDQTVWYGRNQLITMPIKDPTNFQRPDPTSNDLLVILDGAHNRDGLEKFAEETSDSLFPPTVILFGCTEKANVSEIIDALNWFIKLEMERSNDDIFVVLTEPRGGRLQSVSLAKIETEIAINSDRVKKIPNCIEAFEFAKNKCYEISRHNPTIVCVGSLYLVGNILEHIGQNVDSIIRM